MEFLYKTDSIFFLPGAGGFTYRSVLGLRIRTDALSVTLGPLADDPVLAAEFVGGAEGRTQALDFLDILRLDRGAGEDPTLAAVFSAETAEPAAPDRSGVGALYVTALSGPALPEPAEGQGFEDWLAPFAAEELTFDPVSGPVTAPPYGQGQPLDLRGIDGLEFLGRPGQDLLPGTDAERKARVETVALLYEAAFDRDGNIDEGGLNFWVDRAAEGLSDLDLARAFYRNPEFIRNFVDPDTLSDEQYVEILYRNVLDRPSDPNGFAFWLNRLDAVGGDRPQFLLAFAGSLENRIGSEFVGTLDEMEPGIWEFPA